MRRAIRHHHAQTNRFNPRTRDGCDYYSFMYHSEASEYLTGQEDVTFNKHNVVYSKNGMHVIDDDSLTTIMPSGVVSLDFIGFVECETSVFVYTYTEKNLTADEFMCMVKKKLAESEHWQHFDLNEANFYKELRGEPEAA